MLDAGDITYSVNIQTAELLRAERTLDASTRRAEGSLGRVDKGSQAVRQSVTRMAAAISAAISIRQITAYADAWTNLQNRIKTVTDSADEQRQVTERLFSVAQETRSAVGSTADLYTRLRRNIDDVVASDERLLGVTKTINQAIAVSGATAQEADNAIRQLGQGLGSGALQAEEFNSIADQAPDILRAIQIETGANLRELKKLGAEGKITTELVIRALENYSDTAEKEFAGSTRSMGDALQVANNNALKYVGSTNTLTKTVTEAGDAIVFLSENLDLVVAAAGAGATIFGARFVGAMAESTKEYIKNTAAATSNAFASANAAKGKMSEIAQEIKFLQVTQASLAVQLQQAAGTKRAGQLRAQLSANTAALTAATKAYTAAQLQANVAARAGSLAMRGLRGAMGFLGGPAGVILIAAAALTSYVMSAETAADRSKKLKNEVDGVVNSFEDLTDTVATRKLDEYQSRSEEIRAEIKRLSDQIDDTRESASKGFSYSPGGSTTQSVNNIKNQIRDLKDELRVTDGVAFELQKTLYGIGEGEDPFAMPARGAEDLADAAREALSPVQAVMDQLNREYRALKPGDDPFEEIKNEEPKAKDPTDPGDIGLNRLQALEASYQREREILLEAQEAKFESEVAYEDRLLQLQMDYSERRQELMDSEKEGFLGNLEEMGVSFQSLQNQAAGALTNVALGFQSGSEAAKDFAKTAITQVIGAIIRMGIQTLIGQRTVEASSAANAATLSSLYATPAALASLASFGSNSVPAQAGIATTVATTQGLALGTGRLNGGPVQSDRLYPFEENGEPEVLVQNGKSYLRPGGTGEVISNKELTGGRGGDNINMGGVNINAYGKIGSREIRDALYDSGPELYNMIQKEFAKRGRRF